MDYVFLRRSKDIKPNKHYVRPPNDKEKRIDDMFYARMRELREVELIEKKRFDYIESLKRQGKWRTGA